MHELPQFDYLCSIQLNCRPLARHCECLWGLFFVQIADEQIEMESTPTFLNPPVVEFVLGVQFSPLAEFTSAHFGHRVSVDAFLRIASPDFQRRWGPQV